MRLTEIQSALKKLGVPRVTFVETDSLFETWVYGTDLWFKWDRPVGYRLPAVLWNRDAGLMVVKEVRDEGASHKGVVWPMPAAQLVQHLYFGHVGKVNGSIRVPVDIERLRLALAGEEIPTDESRFEPFDREAALARSAARGGALHGAEEIAAAFGGNILKV